MTKWCPYIVKDIGKIKHIYDPIFRINFYVVCHKSARVFQKTIAKQISCHVDFPDGDGRFTEIDRGGIKCGLIWSKDKGITLRHELYHAAVWAMRKAGIPFIYETDEVIAYYTDFLLRCVTKK